MYIDIGMPVNTALNMNIYSSKKKNTLTKFISEFNYYPSDYGGIGI